MELSVGTHAPTASVGRRGSLSCVLRFVQLPERTGNSHVLKLNRHTQWHVGSVPIEFEHVAIARSLWKLDKPLYARPTQRPPDRVSERARRPPALETKW